MRRNGVRKIPHIAEDASEFTVQPPCSFQPELARTVHVREFLCSPYSSTCPLAPKTRTAFMATTQAETTPNPNSLKFTTDDGPFRDDVAAYSSEEEAQSDSLAHRLFSISGVEDVFITPQFVTVSKAPAVDWSTVKSDVESILADHLESG